MAVGPTAVDPLERELIDGGLSSEMAAAADPLTAAWSTAAHAASLHPRREL